MEGLHGRVLACGRGETPKACQSYSRPVGGAVFVANHPKVTKKKVHSVGFIVRS